MRILLDTHALIWYLENDSQMPQRVKDMIENPQNQVFASMVNFWEIAIKTGLGKMSLTYSLSEISQKLHEQNIPILAILLDHTIAVQNLPNHHRDPFDRMLIAQADVESCTVLTRDEMFDAYTVSVLW
jgi:PIN domain nuclease of toxin-antitoxin system